MWRGKGSDKENAFTLYEGLGFFWLVGAKRSFSMKLMKGEGKWGVALCELNVPVS